MKQLSIFVGMIVATLYSSSSWAQTTPDGSITTAVQAAMEAAAHDLILPQAITWLASFMGLQFVITNIGVLKSGGDLETVWAKFLGSMLWFGFCLYLMRNGPQFIDSVGTGLLTKFMPDWISPGYILAIITTLAVGLLKIIGLTGVMLLGNGSPTLSFVVVLILVMVVGVGLGIAVKIFMLKIELGLIIVLAPLSFSLLGLNALKDQGIAPFKSLISLGYRIILFGIICTAFKTVSTTTQSAMDAVSWDSNPANWFAQLSLIFSQFFAYPMLGFLVWKSDSLAASLAGGSTSMGTGDIAGAAAAGAAAGAMAAAAPAAASSVAAQMPLPLPKLGGEISNASAFGAGDVGPVPAGPPLPSLNDAPAPPIGSTLRGMSEQEKYDENITGQNGQPGGPQNPSTIAPPITGALPPPSGPAGSGSTAGVGGGGSKLEENLNKLVDHFASQQKPGKKSFGEHLGGLNQHIGQERAATHVSISTLHGD